MLLEGDRRMEKLLEIKNLETAFRIKDDYFNAVDKVSLDLYRNEVLAIVGESGCGKSTLATTIMRLHNENLTKSTGEIIFNGKNILDLTEDEMNKIIPISFVLILFISSSVKSRIFFPLKIISPVDLVRFSL